MKETKFIVDHPFYMVISTKEEAIKVLMNFCGYCHQDNGVRFECTGNNTTECGKVREEIMKHFEISLEE